MNNTTNYIPSTIVLFNVDSTPPTVFLGMAIDVDQHNST